MWSARGLPVLPPPSTSRGAGRAVVLHEAARAGRRALPFLPRPRRSALTIDNGNHLLLSGNTQALSYLRAIGAERRARRADAGRVSIRRPRDRRALDAASERRPSAMVDPDAAPPRPGHAGTRLSGAREAVLCAAGSARSAKSIACAGPIFDRLWRPLLLAALNTEPAEASAQSRRRVLRETLGAGGRPAGRLWRADGLSARPLSIRRCDFCQGGAESRFGTGCAACTLRQRRAAACISATMPSGSPPVMRCHRSSGLDGGRNSSPDLVAPTEFSARSSTRISGSRRRRTSPRCSASSMAPSMAFRLRGQAVGDGQRGRPPCRRRRARAACRNFLARNRSARPDLPAPLPAWQIVKERRATFAALARARTRDAPASADALAQSFSCRRLDRNRPARHHRRRGPVRLSARPTWRLRRRSVHGHAGIGS